MHTYAVLISLSACYPPSKGRFPRVTHPSATGYCYPVRLACVRHTASVRPEPGSNSPLSKLTGSTGETKTFCLPTQSIDRRFMAIQLSGFDVQPISQRHSLKSYQIAPVSVKFQNSQQQAFPLTPARFGALPSLK